MEISYIHEFVVLAEVGNYMEASATLFISQSALSKHIMAIEKELGVPLFDRTTRRVVLNKYGMVFLEYARQIARLQYDYTSALISEQGNIERTISIGSIPLMAPYHITDAIVRFEQSNKGYSIRLTEGSSSELKEKLRQNQCELAFVRTGSENDDEFVRIPYTFDTLIAVLPADHPLAGRSSLHLEELAGERFLFLHKASILYGLCTDACRAAGFEPNVIYTGSRAENIIDLVEKGMGVSLLMKKTTGSLANPQIALVDVSPAVETQVMMYYKRGANLTDAARHFITSVQACRELYAD